MLECYSDSQLVQGQVANRYETKETVLLKYYHVVKALIDECDCFEMHHIPREDNTREDLFSNLASSKKTGHLKTII